MVDVRQEQPQHALIGTCVRLGVDQNPHMWQDAEAGGVARAGGGTLNYSFTPTVVIKIKWLIVSTDNSGIV